MIYYNILIPRLPLGCWHAGSRRQLSGLWALAWICGAFAAPVWASPVIPGAPQDHPIALVKGTVHPVSAPPLAAATVLFQEGRIVAVGQDVPLPEGTESIDLTGQFVYPGLIDAFTYMGLIEIEAVRATRDTAETGTFNPNVAAQVAFNPDSELIPVARNGGILTVLCAPSGGLFSGRSAVMAMDGWHGEDMTVRADVGMHVHWPRIVALPVRIFSREPAEPTSDRDQALAELRRILQTARAYVTEFPEPPSATQTSPRDLRWEAFRPVLDQRMPLMVEADELQQIESAVSLAREHRLRIVLVGGYDAPACEELLRQDNIPVILNGVHRLPQRTDDAYDAAYTVPARLRQAGIKFCIASSGEPSNVRNLPHHAGTASAFGLSAEDAIRAITLSPAEILGVADRLGSLEATKDATLIVTNGDILEVGTQVTAAYVGGRRVDLSDRQKQLWAKYQEKYRRLGIGKP